MTRFGAALLALLLAFGLTACGDDGDTTISGDNGDVTLSDDLPDDFPGDFPVYEDADFVGGAQGSEEGATGVVATWETGDSADDVLSFYQDELSGDGNWIEVSRSSSPGGSFIIFRHADDESRGGTVTVAREGDTTTILVLVGEGGDFGDADDGNDGTSGDGDSADGDSADGDSDAGDDGDDTGDGADLPEEVELSDDFPADRVPLPDGARVTSTTSISNNGVTTHFAEFYSEQSTTELRDYFTDELESNGWTEVLATSDGGEFFLSYGDESNTETVIVTIGESDVEGHSVVGLTVTTND